MAARSPAWKNPRERLLKKRKSSRCLVPSLSECQLSLSSDLTTASCPPSVANFPQGQNPFRKSPRKKRFKTTQDEEELFTLDDIDDSTANDPFNISVPTSFGTPRSALNRSRSMAATNAAVDFSGFDDVFSPVVSTAITPTTVIEPSTSSDLPWDVRLGTKLRITSKKPFPWMKSANKPGPSIVRVTSNDRYDGLQNFVRESSCSSSPCSFLESASLYWQFPSLPWISLFPRLDILLKQMPKQDAPPLAPTMIDVLNSQWTECFDQLFHSWKKGNRKGFYVCCPTFTVFFTKSKAPEPDAMSLDDSMSCFQRTDGTRHVVCISPTTAGFRQYLRREGVEFEQCSLRRKKDTDLSLDRSRTVDSLSSPADPSSSNSDTVPGSVNSNNSRRVSFEIQPKDDEDSSEGNSNDKENQEKEEMDLDESPTKESSDDWLKEIGVSPSSRLRRHRSMTTMNSRAAKENKAKVDENASITVSGSSIQVLYNLLQTTKATRAIAGPHTLLPPTLIASAAFVGAQLLTLNKSSQIIKKGSGLEYVLELDDGPILPECVQMVTAFARTSALASDSSVQIRVNDRWAFSGLNGKEYDVEWNDLTVERDLFSWKPVC